MDRSETAEKTRAENGKRKEEEKSRSFCQGSGFVIHLTHLFRERGKKGKERKRKKERKKEKEKRKKERKKKKKKKKKKAIS